MRGNHGRMASHALRLRTDSGNMITHDRQVLSNRSENGAEFMGLVWIASRRVTGYVCQSVSDVFMYVYGMCM